MHLKNDIFEAAGFAVRRSRLYKLFNCKDDDRKTFPHKLVFMCGREGIRYLNASLTSLYFCWDKLPEVIIISDGTPLRGLIEWPRKMEVISWEEAHDHFWKKGNEALCHYARTQVFGKKLVSLLYLAEQFPFLYSDTDVLWYSSPEPPGSSLKEPYVKMGHDVGSAYYSTSLLGSLGEERCLDRAPLNAGLMYLYGDFSVYPKWKELCHFLSTDDSPMGANYNEQTAFAILAHHFNTRPYWEAGEVLIKTDDIYNLKYTRKYYPGILARHYVHTRPTAFWRDFVFICWQKKVSDKKGLYIK